MASSRTRVVDNDLVATAGINSGLDLALHLTARELGPDIATQVETALE